MHAPAPAPTPAPVRSRTREGGWGVIEMVIALVIIGILMSIAIVSFLGARGTVNSREAIVAGTGYNDAISRYQADNANKLPTSADMLAPLTGKAKGPRSLLNAAKPYLHPMPDGVTAGRVAVKMTPNNVDCGTSPTTPTTPVGAASALVSYCPGTAPTYGIRVLYKRNIKDPWSAASICWLGRSPNAPRCG